MVDALSALRGLVGELSKGKEKKKEKEGEVPEGPIDLGAKTSYEVSSAPTLFFIQFFARRVLAPLLAMKRKESSAKEAAEVK